ncbi:MAG: PhoU domain-containing protein [Thermoplasmataceae archaeon]
MKELRKLQTTAGGTFILTIPKEWIELMQLKKGSMLSMSVDNNNISVTNPDLKREPESFSINVDSLSDRKSLELSIISSYIQGHDITEIHSKEEDSKEWKEWLRETLKGLIGIEISEEYSDKILLQNLIDPYKFDLTNAMGKFMKNSIAVLSDSIDSLVNKKVALSKDAFIRGKELIRTYRMLMRLAILSSRDTNLSSRYGFKHATQAIVFIIAIREMGRIAYYAMRTAEHATEFTEKLPQNIALNVIQMMQITSEMVNKSFVSLTNKDIKIASEVIDCMPKVRELFEEIMENDLFLKMKGRLTISLIIRDLRAVAGYAVALADDSVLGIFS